MDRKTKLYSKHIWFQLYEHVRKWKDRLKWETKNQKKGYDIQNEDAGQFPYHSPSNLENKILLCVDMPCECIHSTNMRQVPLNIFPKNIVWIIVFNIIHSICSCHGGFLLKLDFKDNLSIAFVGISFGYIHCVLYGFGKR